MSEKRHQFEFSGDLDAGVRGGTRAVLVSLVVSQVISIGVLAVMYRLLGANAYGLFGQILPALMLPRMIATLGLSTAVVQHPELTHKQLSQLFWLNVVGGLVSTAITATLGATIFRRPELASLCLAMAGTNLLAALLNQHSAMLERTLRLARLSIVRCSAQALGGIAGIGMALSGYGVESLVAQQYVELATLAIGVWIALPWFPGRPRRDAGVGSLVTFSSYFSLSALASYITQNWEKLLFPFLMGVHADRAIGLYGQAFGLMIKPVFLLTAPLVGVMVPALARVRGDSQKFADTAARFFRLASIGLLPCAVGLTVVAPDFMLVIAGPKWIDAGPILAALSPAIFAFGLLSLSHFLFAAVGRAGLLLIHSSLFCLLVGQGFFVGYFAGREAWPVVENSSLPTEMGSMVGIAIAFSVVTTCVWLLPSLWFTFRVTGMPVGLVARQVGPVVRPALLMGLVVWALRQLLLGVETVDVRARLVLVVAAGVGLFALLARREMRWFFTEWVQLRRSGGPSDREAPGRSESHSPNR